MNLRLDSPHGNQPPPITPEGVSDLAELAQWRAAFPNQSPKNVKEDMDHLAELNKHLLEAPKKSPVKKVAPKNKKAKK